MNPSTFLTKNQNRRVCELCGKLNHTVKDYAEDYDLQTSLADYLEETTGGKVNLSNISRICDECYSKINIPEEEREERE